MRRLSLLFVLVPSVLVGCRKKPPESVPEMTLAAPLPPPAKAPPPPAPTVKTAETYASIYFDFDRSNIRADQVADLERNLEMLRANPNTILTIEGHCDERGTTDYNLALGERRASEARGWLIAHGVAASRIRTISYGEERPVDPGHDEDAWARNRRDEFHPVNPGERPPVADLSE